MDRVPGALRQAGYSLRADWGPAGARAITHDCDVAVVVDVLSFTTTLTVAADHGTVVYPCRWHDDSASRFAAERNAVLAVGRSHAASGRVSLSPGSLRAAGHIPRLVLPSPNGSAISHALARTVPNVLAVSLRNRTAAAAWLLDRRRAEPALRVAIVAASERWSDGSLRPAAEDQWGAGALVASLRAGGWPDASPEARVAQATFEALGGDVERELGRCAGGRELILMGYDDDVRIAAELDRSRSVPLLREDAFVDVAAST